MMTDGFWAAIAEQLAELRTARSAEDVLPTLPPDYGDGGVDGYFGGSGGDDSVYAALTDAGWSIAWFKASYYYALTAPDGQSGITYVEGDIYRGVQAPQ